VCPPEDTHGWRVEPWRRSKVRREEEEEEEERLYCYGEGSYLIENLIKHSSSSSRG
jgi:hypothetical protein